MRAYGEADKQFEKQGFRQLIQANVWCIWLDGCFLRGRARF